MPRGTPPLGFFTRFSAGADGLVLASLLCVIAIRPAAVLGLLLTAALSLTPVTAAAEPADPGPAPLLPGAEPQAPPSAVCPNGVAPPPAIDTSEVPPPGAPTPTPLGVPAQPVGGPQMASCGVVLPPGAPEPPSQVTADAWLVADLDSGAVLAAKDPHARERPASVLKTLTALLTIRSLRMDDTLVATQEDANQEGSKVGLVPGTTYTVRQVITGLIMNSGNDAAHALAMKLGGMDVAVQKMNALAQQLGCTDTRAATPSGLDGPGMSTSSYDMALIFRAALHEPDFAQAEATREFEMPGPPGQPPFHITSDNNVLMTYPGALGGKTGYTDDAQQTQLAAAEHGGRRVLAVLMHGQNQPVRSGVQVADLLDYGFALSSTPPVGQLVAEQRPAPAPAPHANVQAVKTQSHPGGPSVAGMLGIPVALLVLAGVGVVAVLVVRRRRAFTARENVSDEHP